MRMGRVLLLVGTLLALAMGGLGLAVYLGRDESNVGVDNLLSESFTRAVALSEGRGDDVDLRRLARFDWDRVLIVQEGTPRAAMRALLAQARPVVLHAARAAGVARDPHAHGHERDHERSGDREERV